ncbi:hypothetical protein VULLAG_LOCUS3084 [Vulpes lagopus]
MPCSKSLYWEHPPPSFLVAGIRQGLTQKQLSREALRGSPARLLPSCPVLRPASRLPLRELIPVVLRGQGPGTRDPGPGTRQESSPTPRARAGLRVCRTAQPAGVFVGLTSRAPASRWPLRFSPGHWLPIKGAHALPTDSEF